jgi:hypothetical protein
LIKKKDKEIEDLQTQFIDFEKKVENVGGKVFQEVKKCSHENDNLVNWLKLYDDQIKGYQKEIYDLNLKLYFSQPQQSATLPPSPKNSASPQSPKSVILPLQQNSASLPPSQKSASPKYESLADYFKNQK